MTKPLFISLLIFLLLYLAAANMISVSAYPFLPFLPLSSRFVPSLFFAQPIALAPLDLGLSDLYL
jgi:hypothetical protein